MIQRALISVSDKRGLEGFARTLSQMGVQLIATGGTHRLLHDAGIAVREVADVTEFPEMMNGRVKTLHPRIHGGILALRDEPAHQAAMQQHGIQAIDLVVVNLYPFEATAKKPGVTRAEVIEQIDIGGPSMLRSAAKNHQSVAIVTDPDDYGRLLDELQKTGQTSTEFRRELALKAYSLTARYDAAISAWLFAQDRTNAEEMPAAYALTGTKLMDLRYGENPHQVAAFYGASEQRGPNLASAEFLGGKALSYNNLVDLDAAIGLACEFSEPFACVLKHNNPCGAAVGSSLAQALADAWSGDPLSAFGSVLAFTRPVDLATADFLVSENRFVEAIAAPAFDADALELLRTGAKWGKNVRLLATGPIGPGERDDLPMIKPLSGGFLVQSADVSDESAHNQKCVTRAKPDAAQLETLLFANKICKHVKSNAIVLAKGSRVLGVGAGQMSRVDSVKLAIEKAGAEVQGSLLASDAFFPFPDGVETAMEAGVVGFLQPGGSIRDDAIIEACDQRGVAMVFSGVRHFRH